MTQNALPQPPPGGWPLKISRRFDAPRSALWAAYSQLDHLTNWWGQPGPGWLGGTLDFRPGGRFHYGMTGPQGQEIWGLFDYVAIDAPNSIAFTNAFSNRAGDVVPATFSANWPLRIMNLVTFTDEAGGARLTIEGGPFEATPAQRAEFDRFKGSLQTGFSATFDKLQSYLPGVKA